MPAPQRPASRAKTQPCMVRREGFEPPMPEGGWVTTSVQAVCSDAESAPWDSNPAYSPYQGDASNRVGLMRVSSSASGSSIPCSISSASAFNLPSRSS